jgi:hypothetical protein
MSARQYLDIWRIAVCCAASPSAVDLLILLQQVGQRVSSCAPGQLLVGHTRAEEVDSFCQCFGSGSDVSWIARIRI